MSASWQPTPKSLKKSSSFDKISAVNVQLSSSSQQANICSVPFHHKVLIHSWNHVLEGSAHATLGDARCGNEDQNQFLEKSDNPDSEGTIEFLPKKSGHLQTGGETNHAGSRKKVTLHSGQFVVPGAHDIDKVLGAPNFVKVLEALNFLKCLGHSGAEVFMCLDHWIPHSQTVFCFLYSLCIPPLQIRVGVS